MFGQPFSLLSLFVAVSAWPAEAKNVTAAKSLAITAVGQPRSTVVRSERQHPAAVERHTMSGIEQHPIAFGEMGSSFISETGADVIGANVVEALQSTAPQEASHSVLQSKGEPVEPTLGIKGKIYLRQPAEHKGHYKAREWFCDACHLLAGKGKHGGAHTGCYTVEDFMCAGGEKCLMDGAQCYFGRVELPQGIEVTYYSGFTGEPSSGAWDNACEGRTDRGKTSDPKFPELKGIVPSSPAVCAMKFQLMTGFSCENTASADDWKACGTEGHPPKSHAHPCSSVILVAAAVMYAFINS